MKRFLLITDLDDVVLGTILVIEMVGGLAQHFKFIILVVQWRGCGRQQKILLVPGRPEEMHENNVGKGITATGDAGDELVPPESGNPERHHCHDGQVDEPDQGRGAEMKEEMEALIIVLMGHGVPESHHKADHDNDTQHQNNDARDGLVLHNIFDHINLSLHPDIEEAMNCHIADPQGEEGGLAVELIPGDSPTHGQE